MNAGSENMINASPTKDLFISVLVRDVSIRDAIGDLLDNSVDGALRLRPEGNYSGLWVKIELDVENDRFIIEDNCGGISVDTARNSAFQFGHSEGEELTEYSVGVFGIGMKRALFRLGRRFSVTSTARDSRFEMEVDVDEWKKDSNPDSWYFEFKKVEENLAPEIPEEQRGTKIVVERLREDVAETFAINLDIASLITELQKEHLYNIVRGLRITVNEAKLEAPELTFLVSDSIKPAYWERLDNAVQVRIYAGISEKEKSGDSGGWYIFCNWRLVLGADKTSDTGWGAQEPTRIPLYHSEFYRFRGYVFMEAANPRDLPWNTSKTGLDLDSPIYRAVLQQMITMMRPVIDALDQAHREIQDHKKELIDDTPSENAIKEAKVVPLSEVARNETYISLDRFAFPERAKPIRPKAEQIKVHYMVPKSRYEPVRRYFDAANSGDVGIETFNYFFEREIE